MAAEWAQGGGANELAVLRNAVAGVLLVLIGISGFVGSQLAATAIVVLGLVVLVLASLRWITGFSRYHDRPQVSQ